MCGLTQHLQSWDLKTQGGNNILTVWEMLSKLLYLYLVGRRVGRSARRKASPGVRAAKSP